MISKRIKAQTAIEPGKAYAVDEAINMVRGNSKVKFVESVCLACRLTTIALSR